MAKSYYEGQELAKRYLQYSPTYPKALFEFIVDYYQEGRGPDCDYQLAVDVGCANGQATLPLAEYYGHVVGCDISKAQIANAPTDNERIEFKVSPGEHLDFLDANSVDLLAVSSAFHYMDQEKFYAEAKRVLKPGGVLAIFCYQRRVLDNEEGQKIFLDYLHFLDKYLLEAKDLGRIYNGLELPFPDWKSIFSNDAFATRVGWTLSRFIGSLTASHPWDMYIKENPKSDYLDQIRERFTQVYKSDEVENEPVVHFTRHTILLVGRKPL